MGVGAIVLLIVIFSAGWVVTSGSAQAKAEEMAEDAVLDRLAPICVVQFMQDPNKKERLKELKELVHRIENITSNAGKIASPYISIISYKIVDNICH